MDQLSLQQVSEDKPTRMVLLNSMGSTARMWKALSASFAKHYEIVMVDYPGCGESPVAELDSVDDLAQRVSAALSRLAPKPAHLVGYSLGSWLAARLTAQAPAWLQARSLSLLAPWPRTFPMGQALIGDWLSLIDVAGAECVLRQLAFWTFSKWTFDVNPGVAQQFAAGTLKSLAGVEVLRNQLEIARRCTEAPELGRINVPTLLIRGAYDTFCPRFAADIVAEGIRGSQLVELPKVGHGLLLEAPGPVGELILKFSRDADT